MGNDKWMTTADAAKEFGVTQRYIQILCSGRKRQKGNKVWQVLPKVKKIKYQMSVKNKQMMMIDRTELETIFTKEHEHANHKKR